MCSWNITAFVGSALSEETCIWPASIGKILPKSKIQNQIYENEVTFGMLNHKYLGKDKEELSDFHTLLKQVAKTLEECRNFLTYISFIAKVG
jgi:hypothetical protein